MKRTQIRKANHLSKNGVIMADETDIVFLNVDKNSNTIRINLQSKKSQIRHLSIHEKRSKSTIQDYIQQ